MSRRRYSSTVRFPCSRLADALERAAVKNAYACIAVAVAAYERGGDDLPSRCGPGNLRFHYFVCGGLIVVFTCGSGYLIDSFGTERCSVSRVVPDPAPWIEGLPQQRRGFFVSAESAWVDGVPALSKTNIEMARSLLNGMRLPLLQMPR